MMKTNKLLALLIISLLMLTPMSIPATASDSLTEGTGLNGYLQVYYWDGVWQEVGKLPYGMRLSEKAIDVVIPPTPKEITRLMIIPVGGGAAHLDSAFLGNATPLNVNGETGLVKQKIANEDLDIITIPATGLVLDYPQVTGSQELCITARIENEHISQMPFYFPLTNGYQAINDKSNFYPYTLNSQTGFLTVDGDMAEVQGQRPFFTEYVVPGSGHPEGYVFGWVMNDEHKLYVALDTTPDNTLDSDKDYAIVYVKSPKGVKEFKVTSALTKWGQGEFTYTDKVGYQHKVYEFAIPLQEAGINSEAGSTQLELAFAIYGTMAQLPLAEFLPAVNYQVYGQPYSVAAGDFNGDGIIDIVAIDGNNGKISYLEGNGNGTFKAQVLHDVGYAPNDVVAGEFNGDGIDDLAILMNSGVAIVLGNTAIEIAGSLPALKYYSTGTSPAAITSADFNNDGNDDLAVTNSNSQDITILLGDGDGTFTVGDAFPVSNSLGQRVKPYSMAAGDFNGDGNIDLAVNVGDENVYPYRYTFKILEGVGDGSFTASNDFDSGPYTSAIISGNFYGSGDGLDIVVATWASRNIDFTVDDYALTFSNDGSGNFAQEGQYITGKGPVGATTGDFNNDGLDDFATCNRYDNNITVYCGSGYHFGASQEFDVGNAPFSLITADVNGDDKDDIITVNYGNVTVSVLLNGNEVAPVDTEAPTWQPESELTSSGLLPSGVTLEWPEASDDSGSISKYRIYNGDDLLQEVEGALTTFTLTNLIAETSYTIRLEAVDAAGNESSGGPSTSFTTPPSDDSEAPAWPEDSELTYSGLTRTDVTLEWSGATDDSGSIAKYRIYNGNNLLQEVDGDLTTFTLTNLTAGTSYTINLEAVDAAGNESTEGPNISFTTLSPPSSGGRRHVTRYPGILEFSNASYTIAEDGGSAVIEVRRDDGSDGLVSVQYSTVDGTAKAGEDYDSASGVITFPQGETKKTFAIPITFDKVAEGEETINLVLSNATDGATLGGKRTAVLTITNKGIIIELTVGKLEAKVDGKTVLLEAAPFIDRKSGRTMVPLRFVSEALAGQVQWVPETKQVIIRESGRTLIMQIGSVQAIVDGKNVVLDCPPAVMDPGRTFVPMRFVSENMGAAVDYDAADQSILIVK